MKISIRMNKNYLKPTGKIKAAIQLTISRLFVKLKRRSNDVKLLKTKQ